ncbi:DUF427 domain-containing protein [Microlunatus sp. GCM10028923]|uniref:DUF427 domain-containing protein n=1 Tax=Microlunatus sp. GCM10028923 TaxID=3273400 RepID=UPI0036060FE2
MALQVGRRVIEQLSELQYEPTPKRIRAFAHGRALVDTRGAVLVWEPKRVVPSYAVPIADLAGTLIPADPTEAAEHPIRLGEGGPPVLDPGTAFTVHTTPGTSLTLRSDDGELPGAAFRCADPDLAGHVVLDFAAFDEWREEEDRIYAHPRDPFKRIDVRQGSRHVVISRDGQPLAESRRPKLLFETHIPPRYYLPAEDVRQDLLIPSDTRTECAYKGTARYWSARLPGGVVPDLCWSYEEPLSDAVEVRGLICFFDERVDLTLDGIPQPRPVTPWS